MCTSLEFNEFFGSSFDVPCFVFSSFVVQFSRYRFATALCDSLYSISYSVPFVKGFSKLFSSFFSTFSFAPSRNFLLLFAFSLSSLSLGHRLPCGALLYYHFLPLLSTPFCTFFPFFPLFLPFLFDVSRFFPFFPRLRGGTCLCSHSKFQSMVRGVDLSRYEFEKIFCIHNFMSADNTSRNQVLPTGVGIRQKPWLGKN